MIRNRFGKILLQVTVIILIVCLSASYLRYTWILNRNGQVNDVLQTSGLSGIIIHNQRLLYELAESFIIIALFVSFLLFIFKIRAKNKSLQKEIAERNKTEDSLQLSGQKLALHVQQTPLAVIEFDKEGNINEWNPGAIQMFGFSKEEVLGKSWTLIVPKTDLSHVANVWETLIQGKGGNRSSNHNLAKGGRIISCEWFNNRVINSKGETIGVTSLGMDITDRKHTEEELKSSLSLLNATLDSTTDGILVVDKEEMITLYNRKFLNMFSIPDELIANRIDGDVLRHVAGKMNNPEEFVSSVAKLYGQPEISIYDLFHLSDGRIFERYSQPQRIGNEIAGRVWSFRDITERRKAELLLQEKNKELIRTNEELIKAKEGAEESDRLKSAFLANMSHEIRTPMNGILGFAGLLKESRLTGEEQQEYISIIEESGERMLNIINDIVEISKIESGTMEIQTTVMDINEKLKYIYNFFKPEVERKGMKIILQKGLSARKANLETDQDKLFAVLINLVKNAIKYSNRGTITLGYEKKDQYFEFFVKDTGIGIPDDKQANIFNRFVQVDMGNQRAFEGAGLGLSIAKGYVEMLGGKIRVQSEIGKGSEFYFTIPCPEDKEEETIYQNVNSFEGVDHEIKYRKILIAEDDKLSARLIKAYIKTYCHELISVKTGVEAVQALRNNPDIDLILMDIQMPDMDGYEATREIRQFNKEVIIIAQTAFALSHELEKALAAGCNDYITKPIQKKLLTFLLKKHFPTILSSLQ